MSDKTEKACPDCREMFCPEQEGMWVRTSRRHGKEVCSSCSYEYEFTCGLCGEFSPKDPEANEAGSDVFVMWRRCLALSGTPLKRGIYRILRGPFFGGPFHRAAALLRRSHRANRGATAREATDRVRVHADLRRVSAQASGVCTSLAEKGSVAIMQPKTPYPERPGTTWDMRPPPANDGCIHCGKNYNSHGATPEDAAKHGIPESRRHLICPASDEAWEAYQDAVRRRDARDREAPHPYSDAHVKTCDVCGTELTTHNSVASALTRHEPGNCAQVLYGKLGETQAALRELVDASGGRTDRRFLLALAEARRVLP